MPRHEHPVHDDTVDAADPVLGRLTPEAVREGAGRSRTDELLYDAGVRDRRGIVDHLESRHPRTDGTMDRWMEPRFVESGGMGVSG